MCQGIVQTYSPSIGLYGLDAAGTAACDAGNIAAFAGFGSAPTTTTNVFSAYTNGTARHSFSVNGLVNAATSGIMWAASTLTSDSTGDVGLCRDAAGVISTYNGGACGTTTANYRDLKTRHIGASGTAPTLSSCGTSPTLATGASDMAGTINVGSGTVTACTLTFGTAFTNAPTCVMNDDSTAVTGDVSSISTTAVTFSFSVSIGSGHIYYVCIAGSGM
jgi:hypothetical protein